MEVLELYKGAQSKAGIGVYKADEAVIIFIFLHNLHYKRNHIY